MPRIFRREIAHFSAAPGRRAGGARTAAPWRMEPAAAESAPRVEGRRNPVWIEEKEKTPPNKIK